MNSSLEVIPGQDVSLGVPGADTNKCFNSQDIEKEGMFYILSRLNGAKRHFSPSPLLQKGRATPWTKLGSDGGTVSPSSLKMKCSSSSTVEPGNRGRPVDIS